MTALLEGLRWRLIGPFRGGRSVAVAGHPQERLTFYFGSTGGGVWKTEDAGRTWSNVSDGYFRRASVGAIAVSQSDPNVLYVGMGEACLRNTVSHGDGVYRSDDGGRSWRHLGLAATRHIGRVRVDPRDPDVVYVAALGHAHGPNPERGVYRSRDGGKTWELVLHRSEHAGAVDLCIDGHAPRRLFATTWEVRRRPWRLDSGGEGSGLWRSDDGGDMWTELSRKPGMAKGTLGRIGVTLSPAKEGRVWAIVEAEEGGVYRSDDFGEHWVRLEQRWELRERPFYYSHIVADPCDAETVWVMSVYLWRSLDGGARFAQFPAQHGDCHDLWIDPQDTRRLILADDGGASVSLDGGASYSSLFNQPTAEMYHVTTDNRQPYWVMGCQQDNHSAAVPSYSSTGAIPYAETRTVAGGEAGHIAVHPDNPHITYGGDNGGYLSRHDVSTEELRDISRWPEATMSAGELPHRFNWTFPVLLSPHDPSILYAGAQHVLRSRDEGETWEAISPDLSRNDPDKLRSSGGPLTQDNTGAEWWCTVFALAESPLQRGLLWAGTDDGRLHVTEDGGGGWRDVTPPGIPEWATVSIVEPSPHDAGTAYVAVDNHRQDDFSPYLFRTRDRGASWERIDTGIPEGEFCRVIRADLQRQGMLYCGTEAGVYVSFDDGASWHGCRGSLPVVPVHDLAIRGDDLVAATHGRSFWILDDLPALRQHDPGRVAPVRLYAPRDVVRWRQRRYELQETPGGDSGQYVMGEWVMPYRWVQRDEGQPRELQFLDAGKNPLRRVAVLYELDEPGDAELRLTILDAGGAARRAYRVGADGELIGEKRTRPADARPEWKPTRRQGLNRFIWDVRGEPRTGVEEGPESDRSENPAPELPPGRYRVRIEVGEHTAEAEFGISADPRWRATAADHDRQYELLDRLSVQQASVAAAVNRIRRLRTQIESWKRDLEDDEAVITAADAALAALKPVEERLWSAKGIDTPRVGVDLKIRRLSGAVERSLPPPAAQYEVAERVTADVTRALEAVDAVLGNDVSALNRVIESRRGPLGTGGPRQ